MAVNIDSTDDADSRGEAAVHQAYRGVEGAGRERTADADGLVPCVLQKDSPQIPILLHQVD